MGTMGKQGLRRASVNQDPIELILSSRALTSLQHGRGAAVDRDLAFNQRGDHFWQRVIKVFAVNKAPVLAGHLEVMQLRREGREMMGSKEHLSTSLTCKASYDVRNPSVIKREITLPSASAALIT